MKRKYDDNPRCHLCGDYFTKLNQPTFDRIDNFKSHTLDNIELACILCNNVRSNKQVEQARLEIRLEKYCLRNNLPMTINDTQIYHQVRDGITGGLSNVMHRFNMAGVTRINKFKVED